MSQELAMDKNKNLRTLTTPAKAVNDKSKQDTSKFNKNGRARIGNHNRQDQGYGKKLPPQKSKGFDKRPRPRSYYGQSSETEKRGEVTFEDEAEIGSAQNPGSKKTNLNHLLNFSYSSRRDVTPGHFGYERGMRHGRKRTFNKEQFLQANCKFVVKDSGDYTVHLADPDVLVAWSLIEEVLISCVEEPNCPICLYPPQAAKMTLCGHIYCWPCILHYLALSDKAWRKCPICYEAVKKADLKSVTPLYVQPYNVNDEITMQLMCKQRGSVQVFPVSQKAASVHQPSSSTKGMENSPFEKLVSSSPQQVIDSIINREERELNRLFEAEGDSPESCFIQEALQLLTLRRQENVEITKLQSHIASGFNINEHEEETVVTTVDNSCANKVIYSNAFDDEKLDVDMARCGIDDSSDDHYDTGNSILNKNDEDQCKEEDATVMTPHEDFGVRGSQLPKEVYYFYQASDGQPIYMHALNVKMLVKEYGTLDECPKKITARIVQMEGNTMDDNVRRRLRYLNHLPLQCEFLIAELQFNEDHLSKANFLEFLPEVNKRKRMRQKRARDERKREKVIKSEEDKKKGLYPDININLESASHFPACSDAVAFETNSFVALSTSPMGSDASSEYSNASGLAAGSANLPASHTSFAEMLRDGKKKVTQNAPPLVTQSAACKPDQDSDGENVIAAPDYHQSFSDAIQVALDNIPAENNQAGDASAKKKKGKKKLLFSTNMNRSK